LANKKSKERKLANWTTAKSCPKCKAKLSLGDGFERVLEKAEDSAWGRDVIQVQCERCNTYFGTIDAKTKKVLDKGY